MTSVRSRIPQGRPSRIPGSGIPKSSGLSKPPGQLSRHSNKVNHVSDPPNDNYRLAFVKRTNVDSDAASSDNADNLLSDSDDCEILSLSSADPSPAKDVDINQFQAINGDETSKRSNSVSSPDPITFDRPQSSRSSSTDSTKKWAQESRRSRGPLVKSQLQVGRISSLQTRQKFGSNRPAAQRGAGLKARDSPKTLSSNNQINLPPSSTNLSAANAMEYVKKITSPDSANANRRFNRSLESRMNQEFNKGSNSSVTKIQNPASNANAVSYSSKTEKPGKSRAERRMVYNEAKERGLRNGQDEALDCDDVTANENDINKFRPKPVTETRRAAGRSPKIARPVVRPPRRRPMQTTEPSEEPTNSAVTNDATFSENPSQPEEVKDVVASEPAPIQAQPVEEPEGYASAFSRRKSVPAASSGRFSHRHQRRRASDALQLSQGWEYPISSGISEHHSDKGLLTMSKLHSALLTKDPDRSTAFNHLKREALQEAANKRNFFESGDAESGDTARRKERLRQNERYRDILNNPNIVTFGQYRLQHEGNYAPEEKYGVTERRRIRSSTDSDGVSPCRDVTISHSGDGNTADDNVHKSATSTDAALPIRNDVTSDHAHSEHTTDIEDLSYLMDDLPSIDSSTMMADYTISSSCSTPCATDHHVTNHVQSNVLASKLSNQELRNSTSETGNSLAEASPLRSRASSNDVIKLNGAPPSGNLCSTFDELCGEYQHVKTTLEELYSHLNEEEREKGRLEGVVEKLRSKNSTLTEEVNRMTRILEFQHQSSPAKQRIQRSVRDAETQTEESQVCFGTEFKAMKNDLSAAVEHLKKIKDLKNSFEESVSSAEERLLNLLQEFQEL